MISRSCCPSCRTPIAQHLNYNWQLFGVDFIFAASLSELLLVRVWVVIYNFLKAIFFTADRAHSGSSRGEYVEYNPFRSVKGVAEAERACGKGKRKIKY